MTQLNQLPGNTLVSSDTGNTLLFAPIVHALNHKSGGADAIKLDELAAPTDVTTLDASTTKHGLMMKYPGGTTNFLREDGTFAAPTSTPADPSFAPGTITIATGKFRVHIRRLILTGSQRLTIAGTGCCAVLR